MPSKRSQDARISEPAITEDLVVCDRVVKILELDKKTERKAKKWGFMKDASNPWIISMRTGKTFTGRRLEGRELSTLAAKQALVFHTLELMIGPLTGKRLMDVGSNQGYTTLEAVLRGANVVAVEPNPDNREKTRFVLEGNGFLGNRASVENLRMEDLNLDRNGAFDAILLLGTIYHAERPWEILHNVSRMTETLIIESQIAFPSECNDSISGLNFRAFEEGPGTPLDDPKKNYLRQVVRTTVRVPTRESLFEMVRRAGFNYSFQLVPHDNRSGRLSDLYWRERGIILACSRREIAPTLFDI